MSAIDQFAARFGKQKYLAFSLIAYLIVDAVLSGNRIANYSILAMLIVSGPLAAGRTRLQRSKAIGLALLMVGLGYVATLTDSRAVELAAHLVGAVFFLDLIWTIARAQLFAGTRVTGETLWGAINVYMLFALFFAFLYGALLLVWPNAFAGGMLENEQLDVTQSMVYYSFVTMTTLGYGDITPKIQVAATLAYVQALIGQLYVAILIARLVSLYSAQPKEKEE